MPVTYQQNPSLFSNALHISGFPVLTSLLEKNFEENKDLNQTCLDSISDILKIGVKKKPIPFFISKIDLFFFQKSVGILDDFCILFYKSGLLMKLVEGLENVRSSVIEPALQDYFLKISLIFLEFSNSESNQVKEEMCKPSIASSTPYFFPSKADRV